MPDTHEHAHLDGDPHGHAGPPMVEEPLDPANQSLSDALRLSFKVLKIIMVVLVIAFAMSGVVSVDEGEVVVLSRFGKLASDPLEPGLRWSWPYPIHEQIRVPTSLRKQDVDTFWLRLSDAEKRMRLSDLNPRSGGLNPATDGALLTGDRAIVHLRLNVQYRVHNRLRLRAEEPIADRKVSDVVLFVQNVGGPEEESRLLRTVIENAAVAEAARTTADAILGSASHIAETIQKRAQQALDKMETGILIDKVSGEQSYFPLQAKNEFLAVTTAENRKAQLISDAESDRSKQLLEVAGPAWEPISKLIEKLDQVMEPAERRQVIDEIERILGTEAAGEAGGTIKLAMRDREAILAETLAETARFQAYYDEYQADPQLVRSVLTAREINRLFTQSGIVKWWLPPGDKKLILTLNKDPEEIRAAERDRIRKASEER